MGCASGSSPTSSDRSASSRSGAAWSGCRRSTTSSLEWVGYQLHPETPAGGVPLASYLPERGGDARIRAQLRGGVRDPRPRAAHAHAEHPPRPGRRRAGARRGPARATSARTASTPTGGAASASRATTTCAGWRREIGLDPDAALAATSDAGLLARVDGARRRALEAGVTGIPTFDFGASGARWWAASSTRCSPTPRGGPAPRRR